MMKNARPVIVVSGSGMAVAQAQHALWRDGRLLKEDSRLSKVIYVRAFQKPETLGDR